MTERQKYDFARLEQYCKENNIVLLEDYSGCDLTKTSIIKGKCMHSNCDESFEKKLQHLTKTGAYCKNCIKIISVNRAKATFLEKYGSENILQLDFVKKKSNPNKFTFQKLKDYCIENNIDLCGDYSECHLTKKSCIRAKCQSIECNETVEKVFREIEKRGIYCKHCSNKIKNDKTINTCLKKYGVEYTAQNAEVREKMKNTCIKKYGVEHSFQSEITKNKIKKTMIERYGVENPTKNEEVKNKIQATNLKKYGCTNTLHSETIKEKVKLTMLEKYGVENISQNNDIKNKKIETCIKNYGYEHPLQNAEISEKASNNSYKSKSYTFPSGKIIKCQGYEPFAFRDLVNLKINETDIINKRTDVPEIWYNYNNEEHRYYVDIYVPSQNKCIEVKSLYTFNDNKTVNLLKKEAAEKMGYNFEFWIYDKKGNKICYD